MNIMIVDDEKEIADLIELYLTNEQFNVYKFDNGTEALNHVKDNPPDLAILDVMLPDMDGFSICRAIREKHNFPIIMLTARVEDIDKITGLAIGADDYITKPFNPLEVVARVKAQIRRCNRYNGDDNKFIIDFRGLIINKNTHECTLYDEKLLLTPIEFNILWFLCENKGNVVSSEELFEKVWGEKFFNCTNTVMVHIRRLREKMHEPPRNPKFIKTVWGVGYKIEK